ncbi:uncharacterized protein LOC119668408 [Teleopsis dalmanni]|uniref:uncharacterized protein LOC119668408 n=1 Tax=Teleopsis dalmanni TaxID=139649 RepID=UPI0018CDF2BD|nr:uncharacterized protein LOC119668408 [Teleopsis dalmanni]XP_037933830.1 uncharacterized protein LOC119668408 [Teleopsis dalmanni]XP_037933831.1 uncharacterized protein LOC119668408 [Teleopsis dalmanni]XP_037933832.1 uncharacterized protein LOC119668408 [Teleopsis dalmanni]
MFSSLASFLFGSTTPATTNRETTQNPTGQEGTVQQQQQLADDGNVGIEADNLIRVSSSTPSVTGANVGRQGKRGKNKRNKYNKQNKKENGGQNSTTKLTKLLSPIDNFDEDFNEDEWFIVEKEEEEESLPRTDSEEELSIVDIKPTTSTATVPATNSNTNHQQRRRQQYINSHSLYSGPRPQQQRNLLQRARNSGARNGALNISRLSPPRSITTGTVAGQITADVGVTQSLHAQPPTYDAHNTSGSSNGSSSLMDESWFVTPPPCFTSIGPANMEISPFENLLIEHPSMSVYHSIRSAQEATDSFVNLDLGVGESQQQQLNAQRAEPEDNRATQPVQTQQQRSASARFDRFTHAQLKQELCARSAQKQNIKKERQNICRGAIKRANKVREVQSKGNRQRRSDMQGYRVNSGANNNRKCCF